MIFIYRRVSTDRQDHSVAAQEFVCEQYAQRLTPGSQFQVQGSELFSDPDTSGSIPFGQREGGGALLAALVNCPSGSHLITATQDRLGRDTLDQIATIRAVWTAGVLPHFPSESGALPRTPDNEMLFEIKAAVAQRERNQIRLRITTVLRHRRESGFCVGTVPYGWRKVATGNARRLADGSQRDEHRLEEVPAEQAVLRRILEWWHVQGWRGQRIATRLNREAVPARSPAGQVVNVRGTVRFTTGQWGQGNVETVVRNSYSRELAAELGLPNSEPCLGA